MVRVQLKTVVTKNKKPGFELVHLNKKPKKWSADQISSKTPTPTGLAFFQIFQIQPGLDLPEIQGYEADFLLGFVIVFRIVLVANKCKWMPWPFL